MPTLPKLKTILTRGECLAEMAEIPDNYVDMVMCDLPYGTTACKWDTVIDLVQLWSQYRRICKGAIVLTASQPFTSVLVFSNLKGFKYQWVWEKTAASNFMLMKTQPSKLHEDVCVFSSGKFVYNPQMQEGKPYTDKRRAGANPRRVGVHGDAVTVRSDIDNKGTRFPSSVQLFPNPNHGTQHPTQKPVALMEYLIKTYTNPGMVVLDNCMGSGTTGVACANLGRSFIGIEQDAAYFKIAEQRIAEAAKKAKL